MLQVGQNARILLLTPPAAIVNNAAVGTTEIDTVVNGIKYDYVDIYFMLGATDIAMTLLQLTESDTTGTGFTPIPESIYGGSGNPALPLATDDNKIFAFHVDMRGGRKRFLDLNATIGNGAAGAFVCAFALLSRGHEAPSTAAKRGVAAEVVF